MDASWGEGGEVPSFFISFGDLYSRISVGKPGEKLNSKIRRHAPPFGATAMATAAEELQEVFIPSPITLHFDVSKSST